MNPDTLLLIQTVVGAATVLFSILGASFATGRGIGRIETTMHTISERLAKIEGLFELRLRGSDDK